MRSILVLMLALCASAGARAQSAPAAGPPAGAADPAAQGVVETAERFFEAMAARDTTALQALLRPDALIAGVGPDGRVGVSPVGPWIRAVGASEAVWRERIREPHVEIDGALATLWARYDFHLGEAFSHCGTDAFQMVREASGWRLLAVTFTMQTEGCEAHAAPAGPMDGAPGGE